MKKFNEKKLLEEAALMSDWSRVAFMTCCCERMLPNYARFNDETGFGDLQPLRNALDAAWDWIKSGQMPENIASLVAACEQQAPDTAEFKSIYTSAALDATSAIAVTVESIPSPTKEQAIEVASLARDTVDLFVQEHESFDPNDKNLETLIVESDLMQAELRAQQEVLRALEQLQGSDRALAATNLQARCSNELGSLTLA